MSLYSLRGSGAKFYRHAFILAHKRNVQPPKLSQSPAIEVPVRRAHNGLYDMVKKRTLEARAKMNQQPVDQNPLANQKLSPSPTSSSSHTSSTTNFHNASPLNSPFPSFSKGVKTGPNKDLSGASDVCQNTKVLGATGCQPISNSKFASGGPCGGKPRSGPAGCGEPPIPSSPKCPIKDPVPCQKLPNPCPKPGDGGGSIETDGATSVGKKNTSSTTGFAGGPSSPNCPGDGKLGGGNGQSSGSGGDGKKMSGLTKALYALLAAIGVGGLWLFMRSGNECDDKKKDMTDIDEDCLASDKAPLRPTIPSTSSALPKCVPYILIGGGTAAFSAFRSIKTHDPRAKILMITNEHRKPYMRPPLSKELWYSAKNGEPVPPEFRFKTWTGSERSIFFEPEEFFVDPTKLMENPNGGIAVAQGFTVKKIDPIKHTITLHDGYEINYEKCLIATGCTPKNLPVFQNAAPSVKEKVMVFRTPEDFERLRNYVDQRKSIMIVGNGFTGSELACSLATYAAKGKCKGKIIQVFPETGNMSRVLPDYLSKWTTRKVEAQGVCVIPEASVRAAQRDEQMLKITLNNGNTILTDVVVVCVGCDPNTNLAYPSGLEVHPDLGGFVVNAELQARNDLYVAGDASCFYDPLLGRRRVEHHDHSVISGKLAGENMAGMKTAYKHQSMFWSDLGPEIGYEAVGLVDSALPTVGIFALSPNVERPKDTDNLTENREQSPVIEEKSTSTSPTSYKCDAAAQASAPVSQPEIKQPTTITTTSAKTDEANIAPSDLCNANEDSFGKGVIFYLKNGKVVGILLWNLFNRTGLARTIINQNKKYEDLNEVAKLFEIHS